MNKKLILKNKTICITGASGRIGSKLVNLLLTYDCNIKILIKRPFYFPSKKIKIFTGDLSNPILNFQPFVKNCDYLINCAAELKNTQLMNEVNVRSIDRLISAINKNFKHEKNKKVHWIQLSSCGVYGADNATLDLDGNIINENADPDPRNEYEKTKLNADKILIDYGKKNLIDYTILRPSNVIDNTNNLNIFVRLDNIIKKKFYPNFNFKYSIATYVHVDDVTNSIVEIICNQKSKNNIFNLSINCKWSKIINRICDLNKIKKSNIYLREKVVLPLSILRSVFGNFIYIPTLRTFVLKNIYLSTKIERVLNFKFKYLLPENIENFFSNKISLNKKINSFDKVTGFEKLKDLTVQNDNEILVSVIMSVYNGERFLAESIKSILCQSLKNFEFIIVNDGSTDSSLKIIQEFARKDKRIKVINKLNSGLTHSLNCGIDIAKGDWIARIDADDIAAKSRLMEQYLRGCADDSLVLIGSSCWEIDEFGNKLKKFHYPENHSTLKKNLFSMKKYFPHSSYFIKTKSLKKINGYNLRMIRSQDFDLCLRLSKLGNITSIPKPLVFLRRHTHSISYNDFENKGNIYPRLSLVNYYINKLGLPGPLNDDVPNKDFLSLLNIIKEQYVLHSSKIISLIIKKLIRKNRYDFFSNQWFSNRGKNKILDKWLEIRFNKNS